MPDLLNLLTKKRGLDIRLKPLFSLNIVLASPSKGMSDYVTKGDARLDGNVEFSAGVLAVPFIARAY